MRAPSILLLLVAAICVSSARAWRASVDFDLRADEPRASAAPGYLFCNATTSVLTPSYNATAWCLSAANYDYNPYFRYGGLSNVRIELPTAPTVPMSSASTRSSLTQALADAGFTGSVLQVTDYQRDMGLNIGLSVGTFTLMGIAVYAMS